MILGWSNFYFLVGSASAGLIGLLFVVVTLTAGRDRASALRGATLYITPTLVHFALVFTISAVTMAPDLGVRAAAVAIGFVALAGLACATRSALGIRRPTGGAAHWSDFWLYGGAPVALYLAIAAAAAGVWAGAAWAHATLAALLLTLLLLGVRNAWDTITWIAPRRQEGERS